jgi:hypothetical protein
VPVKNFQKQTALANIGANTAALVASEMGGGGAHHRGSHKVHTTLPPPLASPTPNSPTPNPNPHPQAPTPNPAPTLPYP